VRELTALVGVPQNLVSYHLGRLRADGAVSMRRSSADGRDSYYTVDLAHCTTQLAANGHALHPALALAPPGEPDRAAYAGRRVLFLCTGNSARSQMAEALLSASSGGAVHTASAGSAPKPLHPHAVRAMRERGIDLAGRRSKHLSEFADERWDFVVSLCDRVREVCPEFPDHPRVVHWSIADPARGEGGYPAFQRTATELATRIPFLLELIEHTQATEEAN